MIKFICLFFPTVISLGKYNKEKSIYDYLKLYCINNLIINVMVLLCVSYANKFEYKSLLEESFCPNFAMKYVGLGVLFALIVLFVEKSINISINMEKKINEKKNK